MQPFFVNKSPLPEWFPRPTSIVAGIFVNNVASLGGLVYKLIAVVEADVIG